MRRLVGRDEQAAHAGVHRLPPQTGHHAPGRLAQGDPAGEVHAVFQVAVRDGACGQCRGNGDVPICERHGCSIGREITSSR